MYLLKSLILYYHDSNNDDLFVLVSSLVTRAGRRLRGWQHQMLRWKNNLEIYREEALKLIDSKCDITKVSQIKNGDPIETCRLKGVTLSDSKEVQVCQLT